jgi:transposase-like protein
MPKLRRDRLPDRWTEDVARRVLDECERSGMGVKAFARRQGFTPQRLYWWRDRLGERRWSRPHTEAEVSLVPARVVDTVGETSASASAGVVVRLADDVAIELADATPAYVAALIRALARPA